MKEQVEKILAEGRNPKNAARWIVWLGIGGMALILLSELLPAGGTAKKAQTAAGAQSAYAYQEELETRLEALICRIDGAGRTKVMVTLESGEESVYAVDTQEGEADTEQTHVLLDDGSALTETVHMPTVCGVAVVCEGGSQVHVVAEITEMLSSLLGISTDRISVTKMN